MSEVRKIIKNGAGTYYVSIPKKYMKALRYKDGQKVTVEKRKNGIYICDWEK